MKTGQMLFVACGGIMLGAAGTLAIQTSLMHYEVSLDIRPRASAPIAPLASAPIQVDPYTSQPLPSAQAWQSQGWPDQPLPATNVPAPGELPAPTAGPLSEQQVAEIVAIREQMGHPVSAKLNEIAAADEGSASDAFADQLRRTAGDGPIQVPSPVSDVQPQLSGDQDDKPSPDSDAGGLSRGILSNRLPLTGAAQLR